MKITAHDYLPLLHRCSVASLATHSQALPGYPFVTVLPLALGPDHSPWVLMSDLAEHCRNVRADPRVSLLLQTPGEEVLQRPRLTLSGDLLPAQPDAALQARLLRYCPDFARYLELGDFHFFRLQAQALRFIGGFARMGWLQLSDTAPLPQLTLAEEEATLPQLAAFSGGVTVLGADCYGVDYLAHGLRQRLDFGSAVAPSQLVAHARQALLAGELH